MENRLLTTAKKRVMDELTSSMQRHPRYRDVQVYHKFHTMKERQQAGVILRGSSATRVKLSADDHMGEFVSICNISNVSGCPGCSVEWVWEDSRHITLHYQNLDVTSYLQLDRFTIQFDPGIIITAGFANLEPATNFAQVEVAIDGESVPAAVVQGKQGRVYLSKPCPPGSVVTMTFDILDVDPAGYYLLEMLTDFSFQVTPLFTVEAEEVIAVTSGTETSVSLANSAINLDAPYYLYTQKYSYSNKIILEPDVDYTIDTDGLITFLLPLPTGTTLYATYRWQGTTRGPFTIEGENTSNNTAIKGVVIAFGERSIAGDKHVIQLSHKRSPMAKVSGGHYDMQFDIMVYARDPQALSEMVDHIISDFWGNRRLGLISEGYTIKEMDPTGEAEESYDDAAGIMYFQHSISLSMMTEWKKFFPYVVTVKKINLALHQYPEVSSLGMDGTGFPKVYNLTPFGKEFEVVYPLTGFPRI